MKLQKDNSLSSFIWNSLDLVLKDCCNNWIQGASVRLQQILKMIEKCQHLCIERPLLEAFVVIFPFVLQQMVPRLTLPLRSRVAADVV